MTDKKAYQANPLQPSEMSLLFEIRFARALTDAGLSAQYEHCAGVGNSTVDFLVDGDPPWLVELVSLHESNAFKAASWKSGVWAGFQMGTNANDLRQSEEGETLKAQERIGGKVFDGQQPIKFPEPNGSIHMIMVDARGFLGDGHGDPHRACARCTGTHRRADALDDRPRDSGVVSDTPQSSAGVG